MRELASLLEARLHIIMIVLLLHDLETLILVPLQVGSGVIIHGTHFVNTVLTLLTKVLDEKVFLLL